MRDCTFTAAQYGLRGITNAGYGASNTVLVDRCTFSKLVVSSVFNPGEAWTILNSTFAPLKGPNGTSLGRSACTQDLDYSAHAFNFVGNGCGDGEGGAPWLIGKFLGATVSGNLISGNDPDSVLVIAASNGVAISGNRITGFVEFMGPVAAGGYSTGVSIIGNTIQTGVV